MGKCFPSNSTGLLAMVDDASHLHACGRGFPPQLSLRLHLMYWIVLSHTLPRIWNQILSCIYRDCNDCARRAVHSGRFTHEGGYGQQVDSCRNPARMGAAPDVGSSRSVTTYVRLGICLVSRDALRGNTL